MRIRLNSFVDKAIAIFLFVLFAEISVAIALGISCMYDYHFYASDYGTYALQEAYRVKTDAEMVNLTRYFSLTEQKKANVLPQSLEREYTALIMKYTPEASNVRFAAVNPVSGTKLSNMDSDDLPKDTAFTRSEEHEYYDAQGEVQRVRIRDHPKVCVNLQSGVE